MGNKKKTKKEMIQELNRLLLIRNVQWQRLRKRDLDKLHRVLIKLRDDVAELFSLLEQGPVSLPETTKPPFII